MLDSIIYADNQSKILNIESKYNHLKISKEVDRLKIKQQSYIIISIISIVTLLFITVGYLLYRKKQKKNSKTTGWIKPDKRKFALCVIRIGKEKKIVKHTQRENENYNKMQEEINLLSANYKELQNKSLENSPLFKELTYLANKNKPRMISH